MNFSFRPTQIFVEKNVADFPTTQKILEKFPTIRVEKVSDIHPLKSKEGTKKLLLLARKKSDPLKEFQALSCSAHVNYYSLDLISNCHLECTYCILQSYLENNPILTIYTNLEEILGKLSEDLKTKPRSIVGTGRIADSLALESVTGYATALIRFFANQNSYLELKTKADCVDTLLNIDHKGQTIISWSLAPDVIIQREEYKTADLEERLKAMKKVADAGYKIGLHMDPVIVHEGWQKNYRELVQKIFQDLSPESIFWASVGTLRFPNRQKRVMEKRFPKNQEIFEGLQSTHRRFLHYEDNLRSQIYEVLCGELEKFLPEKKIFTCMEESLVSI